MTLASYGGWPVAAAVTALWLLTLRALDGRKETVARACHELRGPITAARLGLELGSRTGALSAAQLRAIDSELGRATLALADLASATGGHAPPAQLGIVDLPGMLADSVQAWRPSAEAAGVDLRLRCPGAVPCVRADRLRLAQAIANLIANAIAHGGPHVEVLARVLDGRARIEVSDDGPGLPAPVSELVRRARHGRGAHGRGLAIAAAVAAVHGGRLAAAPTQSGARLVLDLPAIEAVTGTA